MIKKYFNKKVVITSLCIIELALIISALVSFSHKDVEMFNVGMNLDNEMLALMLEDDNGEYKESSTDSMPPSSEYRYNVSKSVCVDMNRNTIKDSIVYDRVTKKVTIQVKQTAYCYLYFDQINYLQNYLIKHNDKFGMWESGLEGDGYRFVGSGNAQASTTPKNFICFGTTNKDECVANPNTYMYRIIGVFKDEVGTNHVKLIKYASLPNEMPWNDSNTNTDWEYSSLYNQLNSTAFLNNTAYIPNTIWSNKIANWKWTAVNTLTYEQGGANYYTDTTPSQVYLHEMNRSSKTSSIGSWTTPSAKIGLMYESDYALSLGQTAKNMTTITSENSSTLKTGWIYIDNNLNPLGTSYEWTISRCGYTGGSYWVWNVDSGGSINNNTVLTNHIVRPVFYLTEYNEYKSGTGVLTDPIIIDDTSQIGVEVDLNNSVLTANVTKGDNDLDSYCINNSLKTDDCVWIPITSNPITKTLNETNNYYVHVIDKEGYIVHSKGIYYEIPSLARDLIRTGNMWQSGLDGDGYRYTGSGVATASTTPKNFICFGTNDKNTCTGNPNNYMYRIIGVFPDASGTQYVKLIKYASLTSAMAWNGNYSNDIAWEASDLYKNLNGSTFLTNTTYVPNATWSNKIANWKWTAVNTKTYSDSGPNYYSDSTYNPTNIYLHEMNRSNKASTIGEWTTPSAKIGLMYASDYALSLGQTAKNMTGSTSTNKATLKTGWMHITNNAYGFTSGNYQYEWTISRYGRYSAGGYSAWGVDSAGYVRSWDVNGTFAVRPVFYLASTVQLQSGSGTLADPYIIKE